jgi:Fe-S cluster biogenesis protein NfuA
MPTRNLDYDPSEKKTVKRSKRVYNKLLKIPESGEDNMKEQVIEALKKVRPALQRDGGDIELVSVEENGVVKVRLKGACGSCPMSTMTLKMGVEKMLKQEVPDVKEVVQVA